MNAAIYARVSTSDQNCAIQLNELRCYCERQGWSIVEYVDTGFSGAKASRPALDQLMKDARAKRFDVVVCLKLDRWARSLNNLVESLAELSRLKVRWIATTQNLDSDHNNPTSRLLMHILGSVAEFERELIRERVKSGLDAAKRRGVKLGAKRRVFDKDRAKALQAKGFSVRSIAKQLGIGVGTAQRSLSGVRH